MSDQAVTAEPATTGDPAIDAWRDQASTPDELAAAGVSVAGMGEQAQIDADAAGLGVATIEITSAERVVGIDYEQSFEVGQLYEVPAELAAFLVGSGSAWIRLPALLGPGAYVAAIGSDQGHAHAGGVVWVRLGE